MSMAPGIRQYVPLQWANDLAQMLSLTTDRIAQNQGPIHLIGYSMGGYIAALAALENPKVASLTLVGYNPIGLSSAEQAQRQVIIKAIEQGKYRVTSKQRLKSFLTTNELPLKDVADTINSMAEDLGANTLKVQFQATTPRKDLTEALAKLSIPVHFITAAQDKIASEAAIKHYAQNYKNMSIESVGETAHMMLLTRPEQCAKGISNFIAKHTH